MKNNGVENITIEQAFKQLKEQFLLEDKQIDLYKQYAQLLITTNQQYNITAITSLYNIIYDHFYDSLIITNYIDFSLVRGCADVGSGGGFPGLAIKIKYPHLPIYLIEVNQKKVEFLTTVIKELSLENVEVISYDWRTFLRKTSYPIDLFMARASLQLKELFRLFQPSCGYHHATLVYWASRHWLAEDAEKLFFDKEVEYNVDNKKRKLIFFTKK